MVKINICFNSIVTHLALLEIVAKIETRSGLDELLQHGIDPELIDLIRNRPARDLREIAAHLRTACLTFDQTELRHTLQQLDMMRRDREKFEYFVKHGASRQMCRSFFRISLAEIKEYQEALLGTIGGGRVSLPPHEQRDEIHHVWSAIQRDHEKIRDQLYELHVRYPAYTIESLWQTVNEFNDSQERAAAAAAAAALAEE